MKRLKAIDYISKSVSEETRIVFCNGATAREGYYCQDRDRNFYLLAAMGHAASTAMGMAETQKFPVVAVDGDGNILMNFNVLPAIGSANIKNFVHIVFDNQAYETTGAQKTILGSTALDKVADECGYDETYKVENLKDFKQAFLSAYNNGKKAFIWACVQKNTEDPTSIIPVPPTTMTRKCMK